MVNSVLVFENGKHAYVRLPSRPIQGEIIHFKERRYMVRSVTHHATDNASDKDPILEIHLGIGRGVDDSYLMEKSSRGFFTG